MELAQLGSDEKIHRELDLERLRQSASVDAKQMQEAMQQERVELGKRHDELKRKARDAYQKLNKEILAARQQLISSLSIHNIPHALALHSIKINWCAL